MVAGYAHGPTDAGQHETPPAAYGLATPPRGLGPRPGLSDRDADRRGVSGPQERSRRALALDPGDQDASAADHLPHGRGPGHRRGPARRRPADHALRSGHRCRIPEVSLRLGSNRIDLAHAGAGLPESREARSGREAAPDLAAEALHLDAPPRRGERGRARARLRASSSATTSITCGRCRSSWKSTACRTWAWRASPGRRRCMPRSAVRTGSTPRSGGWSTNGSRQDGLTESAAISYP